MKMSVLYFSKSGNTKKMAEYICEGMMKVNNVEAKAMSIDDVDADFVKESNCVVVGSPVYYTSMAGEMKLWLDKESGKLGMGGKLCGAFATSAFHYGGGEITIQNILIHLLFNGGMAYSGGSAHGAPPIHLGPIAFGSDMDSFKDLFVTYGERMATRAFGLFTTCC